jgi:hypothetical protein
MGEPKSGAEPLTCSLRVIDQALPSVAEVCTYRITRAASELRLGLYILALRRSSLSEKSQLPLLFWAQRPGGRLPRLVLLVEPAVDEGTD